ncbi:hypothetical protein JCM3765_005716 [Sporobolomyces pararoseus]
MATTSTTEQQVVLVTADDPPVRQSVSRSRLCVLSNMFADMLSMPVAPEAEKKEDGAIEVTVTETDKELSGFLRLVRGEPAAEGSISRWPSQDIVNLAKLSDKYNSPYTAAFVRESIWMLLASRRELKTAFLAAIALEDRYLIAVTCGKAIENDWHRDSAVPTSWTNRLVQSMRVRKLKIFEKLISISDESLVVEGCSQHKPCSQVKVVTAWKASTTAMLQGYQLTSTIEQQLYSQLVMHLPLKCAGHARALAFLHGNKIDQSLPRTLEIIDSEASDGGFVEAGLKEVGRSLFIVEMEKKDEVRFCLLFQFRLEFEAAPGRALLLRATSSVRH